jgi:hypothetical protein
MIKQLGPITFFITFISIERLCDPFIKVLHTLHVLRLNLPNKIKDLQLFHITKLIQSDPVTCARY